jgi:hypothetical protein
LKGSDVLKNKRIIISLIITFIILTGTSCNNNLFNDPNKQNANLALTEEQKKPEYAIENYMPDLKNGEYKYLIIDDFLFVSTKTSFFQGVKTEKGGFEFVLPYDIDLPEITKNTDNFMSTILVSNLKGEYSLSVSVNLLNQNPDIIKVLDNTGMEFSVVGDDVGYQKRWVKVLKGIPDDYKILIKINGNSYEVVNKETILENESKKQMG